MLGWARMLTIAVVMLVIAVVSAPPPQAQLLLVTGNYRLVELDQANQRVGVSLPEASPEVRQNWIYLEANTEIVKRSYRDGWFKDERLTYDGFFDSVSKGEMMKVHGGRRWDGGITARKIWM
ncbi:MAG: hypothetical protein HY319_29380 [Armatimonadetes bacterium]|nr:hypothetical protein [Armatimonadota bacterium]